MTKAQERGLERIRRMAENSLFFGDDYEFKFWEVDESEYNVAVFFEVGAIGDEGTMAQIFGRYTAQFFIGKRGGVTYYKELRDKDGNYKGSTRKSLCDGHFFGAVLEQSFR